MPCLASVHLGSCVWNIHIYKWNWDTQLKWFLINNCVITHLSTLKSRRDGLTLFDRPPLRSLPWSRLGAPPGLLKAWLAHFPAPTHSFHCIVSDRKEQLALDTVTITADVTKHCTVRFHHNTVGRSYNGWDAVLAEWDVHSRHHHHKKDECKWKTVIALCTFVIAIVLKEHLAQTLRELYSGWLYNCNMIGALCLDFVKLFHKCLDYWIANPVIAYPSTLAFFFNAFRFIFTSLELFLHCKNILKVTKTSWSPIWALLIKMIRSSGVRGLRNDLEN